MRAASAKSVLRFEGHACVARSTYPGIPWLRKMRREVGRSVHFRPFGGRDIPEDRSVLAEVDPSIVRNRYPKQERTVHQHAAYSVARWLFEADRQGALDRFYNPTRRMKSVDRMAGQECWILGVT
jgi:hypothetical protein